MLYRHLLPLLVSLSLLVPMAFPAGTAQAERVIVSPTVRLLETLAQSPPPWLNRTAATAAGFAGSIRFVRALSDEEALAIEALGVTFGTRSPTERFDHIGSVYPAFVRWEALHALETHPLCRQIDGGLLLPPIRPLKDTLPMTGADLAGQAILAAGGRPGEGITIADIDSGIDVLHPAFFFPDGGYYNWIDVDGDGMLGFGTDACDLDGDGKAGPGEIMYFLEALEITWDYSKAYPDGFQAGLDWIYVDIDGDAVRDRGPEDGYDDAAPGFGEPLLLFDDVNENGKLDLEEKMVMLGTSKIAGAFINGEEYLRGDNLTALELEPQVAYPPEEGHGTGVAGILVAGVPKMTRHVGMAPYADILMVSSREKSFTPPGEEPVDPGVAGLLWARDHGANLVLHEYSSWGMEFLDGTSNLNTAMDTLHYEERVAQVTPAGNLADSGKHMTAQLTGSKLDTMLVVPQKWPGTKMNFESRVAIFTFY